MKRTIYAAGLISLLLATSAFAHEREIGESARQLSADFRKKNPTLDFRTTLAVARFKTGTERLEQKGTSALIRDAFQKEFMRSLIFEVVERENLEKITAEIELKQKGLTQGGKGGDENLKTAEYLLVGDLAEDGQTLSVSARLVQVSTGAVIATASTRIPLGDAEKAADDFRYNAFQSQYGITLGADGSMGPASRSGGPPVALASAFIAYRVARPVRLGLGMSYFIGHEYIREEITGSGGTSSGRNYNLSGVGGRFFADFLISPYPRWNLGVRADVHFMPGMKLEQDVSDMSVWEFGSTGAAVSNKRRVIVNGTSTWGMTIFKPALLIEFLISKRLSVYFSGGYAFSTVFKPVVFESGGYRQWDESNADKNGTFAQYQNFNFARRPDGSPVEFQLSYGFIDVGLSLHF